MKKGFKIVYTTASGIPKQAVIIAETRQEALKKAIDLGFTLPVAFEEIEVYE